MNTLSQPAVNSGEELSARGDQAALAFPPFIAERAQKQLLRMFRDPYLLEPQERVELIAHLREAVSLEPQMAELRVLLGMGLCVNFEAQEALEELRESVRLAPDSFVARLKLGELLMRLRVCTEAAEQTHIAAELASNTLQSELARRQATAIRGMLQAGVERGAYPKLRSLFKRPLRFFGRAEQGRRSVVLDTRC